MRNATIPFPMPAALQTAAAFWPVLHLNPLSLAAPGLKAALSPWAAASVLAAFSIVCVIVAAGGGSRAQAEQGLDKA
jgi:hypothetical protein